MTTDPITIALERYERHVPFFTGEVTPPPGLNIRPLEIGETTMKRDGLDRHHRMLTKLEFDVCEMSLVTYIMGTARDPEFPMVAVPVFPRRFFSMSQIYVNAATGIDDPKQLAGRKVGIHAWQVTLSVLAKGDLKREYGLDWRDVDWYSFRPEPIPIPLPDGVSLQRIPEDGDIGQMLVDGEIDALITPQPRKSMLEAGDKVRRLFPDPRAEERRFYQKYGFYPVMHIMVMRRDTLARHPELPQGMINMWEQAKRLAYEYYEDPNFSLLAWGFNEYQAQQGALGLDPWPSGVAANKANLEQFIDYCDDQGLLPRKPAVEELFDPSVRNS